MQAGSSPLRKLGTLFGGVLFSKLLGVVRELAFAFFFGTSYIADAFRVASSVVLIPTHLLTGEALFSAFIPPYKRLKGSRRMFFVRMIGTGVVGLSVVSMALLIVGAPLIVRVLAPGFEPAAAELCGKLIRVAAVSVVLYAVSALFINLQVAHDNYGSYSARPAVQNIGILAAIVAASAWNAPVLLGLGFVLAFLILAAWSLLGAHRSGIVLGEVLRPTTRWSRPVTSEFRRALVQLSLFVVLAQVSLAVDRVVGSLTGEGGVAALDYAFFVTDSARFLVAVPLATFVIGRFGGASWSSAVASVEKVIGVLVVAAVGMSVALWAVSFDIVTFLYRRGEFQEISTQLTTASLQGFAVGAWAITAAYVLQRLFNATLRNREVAIAGAWGLLVNIVLDLALYRPLGVLGIALATSISNMVILLLLLRWSGLLMTMVRRVGIPTVAVAVFVLPLQRLSGSGWQSLVWAAAALGVFLTFVFLLWRPLREDVMWLVERARSSGSEPG